MTLYELTGQLLELLEMAEDKDTTPEALADTMEAIQMEMEEKADGYAKIIQTLQADASGLKEEIDRMDKRKKAIESNISRLKRSLQEAMAATGKTKFKTQLFSFSIQKNAPSLDVVDEGLVPEEYRIKQPDKIDKRGILAYIKEHGPTEWATIKQTESLRIH